MRAIVFANGEQLMSPQEIQEWVRAGDIVIAADGGTHHALEAGMVPSVVIGDQDSLDAALRGRLQEAGTRFLIFPAMKDETDLELALLWAAEQEGVDEIVILAALGGRHDQALANLLLLAMPELAGIPTHIVDSEWDIQVIHSGAPVCLHGHAGDTVSLLPLGGAAEGVTTSGLAYPLRDEALRVGPARGVSNVLLGQEAMVQVRAGLLWCLQHRSLGASSAPAPGNADAWSGPS